MLIKFTKGGRGGGNEIAKYLMDHDREGRDLSAPELVRGDINQTRDLINSIDRKWSYTHGVLSFALEDAPTESQQLEAMDAFERLAFAGMDAEQYDISWVRHQHTKGGRVELHFVSPRMELTTGKALNIAPPGWAYSYAPLRDALNWQHGWARPDDPVRAVELQGPPERAGGGFNLKTGRDGVHDYLTELVVAEIVTDRASLVAALEDAGLKVPRQGQDYLTVQDPESGDRFRMKGRIYNKDWTYDGELDRAIAGTVGEPNSRDRSVDLGRAASARSILEERIRSRAAHNAKRYPRRTPEHEPRALGDEADRTLVVDRLSSDMDDDSKLISLALDATRSDRNSAISDVHTQWPDIPDFTGWDGGHDLPSGQSESGLRGFTDGELNGPTYAHRAVIDRTIRNFGERIRNIVEGLKKHIRSIADVVQVHADTFGSDRAQTERYPDFPDEAGESLERARKRNRQLADCSERLQKMMPDNREVSFDFPDPKPWWAR